MRSGSRILLTLLAAAVIGLGLLLHRPTVPGRVLEIELTTSDGGVAQIYWDDGEGFVESRSLSARLERTGAVQAVRFPLPDVPFQRLRFDPIDGPGTVVLRRMRVLSPSGVVIAEPNPQSLFPFHQIASMVRGEASTRIVTVPAAWDPILLMDGAGLNPPAVWYDVRSVTPLAVLLANGAMLLLIGASVTRVLREIREPALDSAGHPVPVHRVAFCLGALFVLIVTAKLYTLRVLPLPVPSGDQWAVEPELYIAFSEGRLTWSTMFGLHNEHRIFFTRLWDLLLLLGNRQWDPRVQQVTTAMFHALTGVVLAGTLWLAGRRRSLDSILLGCGLTFVTPFAWENTTMGFQSAFYFLLLFSVLALWLTSRSPAGTTGWALGWTCALCSLFTSAGGLITAGIAALVSLRCNWPERFAWRGAIANLAAAGAVLALGVGSMASALPGHAPLRSTTVFEFAGALARNLAWPWIDQPAFVCLVWSPVLLLAARSAVRRQSLRDVDPWVGGLGLWVALQAAALAYARGGKGQVLAARYMDFLSLGLLINITALIALLGTRLPSRLGRPVLLAGSAMWLAFCVAGLDRVTRAGLANAAGVVQWEASWVSHIRRFVLTDDPASLATARFPQDIPYQDAATLGNAWLRHPYIRRILPPALAEPLPLPAALLTNRGFEPNGYYPTTPGDPLVPAWGSYTARLNSSQGRFESASVPACSGVLRFDVAGYLGEPGLSLGVHAVSSGTVTPVRVRHLAGEEWISAYARCPDGPFQVVAIDANARYWFAFRPPVVVGWWSLLAEELVDRSRALLLIAAGVALAAVRLAPAP